MTGKLLIPSIVALCLLSGCSMDSFGFLHGLTSSLKENVFTDVLGADVSQLLADIDGAIDSISPLEYEDGYRIGAHRFDPGTESRVSLMPPLGYALLDSLAGASENRVKVEKITSHLSARASAEDARLVVDTYDVIRSVVDELGEDHKAHDVLERFVREIEVQDVTMRDVVALGTLMYVLSAALDHFPSGVTVDMEMVRDAFSMGIDEMSNEYIDSFALALGMGKSASRAIGSQWLFWALDGVLLSIRGAM